MYIRQCVPQGSHLTTLPISFYLFPVPLVNAVLQPTEWGGGGATRCTARREQGGDRVTPATLPEYQCGTKFPGKTYKGTKCRERVWETQHGSSHTKHPPPKLTGRRRESRKGKTSAKPDPLGRHHTDRSLDETLGPVPFRSAKHAV